MKTIPRTWDTTTGELQKSQPGDLACRSTVDLTQDRPVLHMATIREARPVDERRGLVVTTGKSRVTVTLDVERQIRREENLACNTVHSVFKTGNEEMGSTQATCPYTI
ncbi:MAG: hypothetical protein V2B18_24430 [Pseudomonadota bacterium]